MGKEYWKGLPLGSKTFGYNVCMLQIYINTAEWKTWMPFNMTLINSNGDIQTNNFYQFNREFFTVSLWCLKIKLFDGEEMEKLWKPQVEARQPQDSSPLHGESSHCPFFQLPGKKVLQKEPFSFHSPYPSSACLQCAESQRAQSQRQSCKQKWPCDTS